MAARIEGELIAITFSVAHQQQAPTSQFGPAKNREGFWIG